jgi:DNA repair ATPase RecN
MRINKLEIENVKRVRALKLEPSATGLTVIGGRNRQGKTSVLDAIAWALGGDKYRPANPQREGSVIPPLLKVELSNGIVVERKGKNSALTVTDPKGEKAGQMLLDAFVEKLALDLPKFMQASNKEKADTLLRIIGVEEELKRLREQEQQQYNQRRYTGQVADQKAKYAKEMQHYPDVPPEPVSVSELIQQQQDILARNGENQRKRDRLAQYKAETTRLDLELQDLEQKLAETRQRYQEASANLEMARRSTQDLQDESTAELEQSIRQAEDINRKVRANLDREKAEDDAREHARQYDLLSNQIDATRKEISDLLTGAQLPLPGLSVNDNNELTYNGFTWDDMSSSEQLQVATAIVRKLNPNCEFVLIDKLETMDVDTLREFGAWLEAEGLQAICTRVSTGEECQIIIEDGMVVQEETPAQKWQEGVF